MQERPSAVKEQMCLIITFCSLIGQRRLGDAAKKAISQLQVRTIRKGDQVNKQTFDIAVFKPVISADIESCRLWCVL